MASRRARALPLLLLLLAACASHAPLRPEDGFLGLRYPMGVRVSYPAALFHWVDSLAGTSGGKTVPGYREQYKRMIGEPDDTDRRLLARFIDVRRSIRERSKGFEIDGIPVLAGLEPLAAFVQADTLDDAFTRLAASATPAEVAVMRDVLAHFATRYDRLWQNGRIPRDFTLRVPAHERRRLGELLGQIQAFFEPLPGAGMRPELVPVPVPEHFGTHAQAIGPLLLIEVRQGDDFREQASVIVHENAHVLWHRVGVARLDLLQEAARVAAGGDGRPFRVLREALPAALGQGVAGREFESDWSTARLWYHLNDVDTCAKRIYPLVRRALSGQGRFDERFIAEAAASCRDLPPSETIPVRD